MGMTHVQVAVCNPGDPSRRWSGRFLVDTGAFDTLVPRQHLDAIGVEPRGQRTYALADGTVITMDVGVAQLEILGELGADVVVFGDGDVEPILGVTALESAAVVVDPRTQSLIQLPASPLKCRARARARALTDGHRLAVR